jgi:hypothetical protein
VPRKESKVHVSLLDAKLLHPAQDRMVSLQGQFTFVDQPGLILKQTFKKKLKEFETRLF